LITVLWDSINAPLLLHTSIDFINVKFLPPKTTSILQLMDKLSYCQFQRFYYKIALKQCICACDCNVDVPIVAELCKIYDMKDAVTNIAAALE